MVDGFIMYKMYLDHICLRYPFLLSQTLLNTFLSHLCHLLWLVLWQYHTTYFDRIYLPPLTPPTSTLLSYQPNLISSLFFIFFLNPYALGCMAFHFNMVGWPEGKHFQNFFLSRQLFIANSSSVRTGTFIHLPTSGQDWVWLLLAQILCVLSQLLWVHVHNCAAVYRKQFPCSHQLPLDLRIIPPPLP